MKRNKAFIAMFCLIITLSGASLKSAIIRMPEVTQSSQSYWDRFKQGMQAIYTKITSLWQRSSVEKDIPTPFLIGRTDLTVDHKTLKEFRYDVSRDNETTKNIRKKLGLSGIYVADGSSKELHKKALLAKPAGPEYRERGFNVENDNSVSNCLAKVLAAMSPNAFLPHEWMTKEQIAEQYAYIQLLWEIEDSLSDNFTRDSTSKEFIEFAHKMYPDRVNKLYVDKEIASCFDVWARYSKRFNHAELRKAALELWGYLVV